MTSWALRSGWRMPFRPAPGLVSQVIVWVFVAKFGVNNQSFAMHARVQVREWEIG